jgi:hypothetical protein
MKILNSSSVSSFGGLNFVLKEFDNLGLDKVFNHHLPFLPAQSKYSWKDIIYSLWSLFYCGADCAEDLNINIRAAFKDNPYIKVPSPDRVLSRLKELSEPSLQTTTPRGNKLHHMSYSNRLNKLNLSILKRLRLFSKNNNVLDYDNTVIFTDKADASVTYKGELGYYPGVGMIGKNVVYVENRSGYSDAQTLQQDTLERMFRLLKSHRIKIDAFRADSASYQFSTLITISKNVDKFYIKARMNEALNEAINQIEKWDEITINNQVLYRGEVIFTPFRYAAKKSKQEHLLKSYRLIVTKEKRIDGQRNLFTGEAYKYTAIITNDYKMDKDQIVCFYNQRGAIEKEFDVLKNDFGWNHIPFSKLNLNTVFLMLTAICKNIYHIIIATFSRICKYLSPTFRIKKFIFRFICIPAKWVSSGRTKKLKLYGNVGFKT